MRPLIRTMLLLIGIFVTAGATCASAQTPSPPGAKVYFKSKIIGLPGKPGNIDGKEVEAYFRAGRVKEIAGLL